MLEPIPNAVEKFIAHDDEPVVMLNLLRFLDVGVTSTDGTSA